MVRRREGAGQRSIDSSPGGVWLRFVQWQTPFSVVSSMLSLVLALVFVSDLIFGHPHVNRANVTMWLVLYAVAALLPLLGGQRFPRWAGIVIVVAIESWSTYFLLTAGHAHAEINALLELPMIALYLGWFYRALIGRSLMVLSVSRDIVLLIIHPGLGHGVVSANVTVAYAVLFAVFCFEGARALRRQGYRQSITDPLTGALNRRGLTAHSPKLRRDARRRGQAVTVAVLDFDDFRAVNEEGGHLAGDEALRAAVAKWQVLVSRRGGIVARLGGDEFALLLRNDVETVKGRLCELRTSSTHAWTWGAVSLAYDETLEDAIARADELLYSAKQSAKRSSGRGAKRIDDTAEPDSVVRGQ